MDSKHKISEGEPYHHNDICVLNCNFRHNRRTKKTSVIVDDQFLNFHCRSSIPEEPMEEPTRSQPDREHQLLVDFHHGPRWQLPKEMVVGQIMVLRANATNKNLTITLTKHKLAFPVGLIEL